MSTSNPTGQLGAVITNPAARRLVYGAFVVLSVIAGAITVGVAVLGNTPDWVTVMNTVLAFLGIPVGGLAVANTKAVPATPSPNPEPEQPLE